MTLFDGTTGHCNNCGHDDVLIRRVEYGSGAGKDICEFCDAMPYSVARENLGVALSRLARHIVRELRR